MSIPHVTGRPTFGVMVRPLNCNLKLDEDERCPNCGLVHLRPGYCMALDPIHADKYPHLHGRKPVNTEPSVSTEAVSNVNSPAGEPANGKPVNSEAERSDRAEYMRDYMRRKRAEKRTAAS